MKFLTLPIDFLALKGKFDLSESIFLHNFNTIKTKEKNPLIYDDNFGGNISQT